MTIVETKLISSLKRPKEVNFIKVSEENNRGIFSAKPYEKGFGTTIGNSLRRTLLSVIPGYSVVAIRVSGVNNEFQNIEGVFEDTIEIIANLKALAIGFKDTTMTSRVFKLKLKGSGVLKGKDFLSLDNNLIIGNLEHEICSYDKLQEIDFEVQVEKGRGYVESESFREMIQIEGTIPIDADYSPILNVSFKVKSFHFGNNKYYEELEFDIKTKGTISPEAALQEAAQILKESYKTFGEITTEPITSPVGNNLEESSLEKSSIFNETIYTIPFSVRTHFFLKMNEMKEIGQIVIKNEKDLLSKKYCNEAIIEDIKEKISEKDLSLDMKNIDYIEKGIF